MNKNRIYSNQKSNREQLQEQGIDYRSIYRAFYGVKKYIPHITLSFIMVIIVAFVNVIIPYMVKITIDEIMNDKEKLIYEYERYHDISSFRYEGKYYSLLSGIYKKPDAAKYYIKHENERYLLPADIKLDKNYSITEEYGLTTLNNLDESYIIHPISDEFIRLEFENRLKSVEIIFKLFIILIMLAFALSYLQTVIINYVSHKIVYDIRTRVFGKLIRADLKTISQNPVGKIVTRISSDVEAINLMYTDVVLIMVKDLLIILGTLYVMYVTDSTLTMICILVLFLFVLFVRYFKTRIQQVQKQVRNSISAMISKLSEYISGMHIIQVFNAQELFYEDYKKDTAYFGELVRKRTGLFAFFRPISSILSHVTTILILLYCVPKVLYENFEIGLMVMFITYTRKLYDPINDFSERYLTFQNALVASDRLSNLVEGMEYMEMPENPISADDLSGSIEFKNVSFKYEDEFVLNGVSFKVPKNTMLGIVGHTGSGKSTIINLITRFYDINQGNIYFDGKNIRDFDIFSLRSKIGMVLQEVYLFSCSIYDNIRLYNEDISDEKIEEVCKLIGIHDFIMQLDGGYEHILREKGRELSVGQRQLIAIARAICIEPKIIIMDEATANLDSKSEQLIQNAIETMANRSTLIIIAHRLSTIKSSDNILVLDSGSIVESGNHEELLKKKGYYYNLYQMQFSNMSML